MTTHTPLLNRNSHRSSSDRQGPRRSVALPFFNPPPSDGWHSHWCYFFIRSLRSKMKWNRSLGSVSSPWKQLPAWVPPGEVGAALPVAVGIRDGEPDEAKRSSCWVGGSFGHKHSMFNIGLCHQQHYQPIFWIFDTVPVWYRSYQAEEGQLKLSYFCEGTR